GSTAGGTSAGVTGSGSGAGPGGARTGGTGAAGAGGAERGGALVGDPESGGAEPGGPATGNTETRYPGTGGASSGGAAAGGAGPGRAGAEEGLTERPEPASRPILPVRSGRPGRRVPCSRQPAVTGTHLVVRCPSSPPQRVPLPSPLASSLPTIPEPESDHTRAVHSTVTRLLATVVTDPSFESAAASALVCELVDFAAACRLDYAASLVAESDSVSPPSVGGECALGMDVLEHRQEELECLAAAAPHLVSMLLAPEGDPDALDIPTPRSYADAIASEYSSHWQIAMDAKMASWKSKGTYVDEVPPPGVNIVSGMWIFRVKPPPGSPPDLVFATADTEALALVKSELQKRHTCTDLGELRSYLGLQITRDKARRTITLTQSHMVQQVLQRFGFTWSSPHHTPLATGHSLLAPPSDESVEPSGPYPELVGCLMCTWMLRYLCGTLGMGLVLGGRSAVVLAGHLEASWVDDQATQRSSQGYTFSLGSGSVSWRSTRSSSILSSSCEAEIYATAMAAQELRWLTYLLTDLGERPRSPPVLYVDNKAAAALCQEHRLEHRTKHMALRYFLARELQQRGQLCLAHVAIRANTTDIFTKALPSGDHQRFCTLLGLVPTLPHLL
ncbi:unnamed protein product, partial [Closterium sp. NIES-54]